MNSRGCIRQTNARLYLTQCQVNWSPQQDSNLQPNPYKELALSLSYRGIEELISLQQ